jgi:hypothetical protein
MGGELEERDQYRLTDAPRELVSKLATAETHTVEVNPG